MKTLALLVLLASSAQASEMEYIHKGSGASGTLDGVVFSNADFTISSIGDTGARVAVGTSAYVSHLSSTITISGLGTLTLLTSTRTFVNNAVGLVGFSRDGDAGNDLFNGPFDDQLKSWDLTTPIGPILGSGQLLQWALTPIIDTDKGVLIFDNQVGSGSFQAVVAPAPGACVLAAAALGFGARRRRAVR